MWVKSKNTPSCMQQNASIEYKSASNKVKQLYKALRVTGTAFFMWKLELFYTRSLQNNETPRQKSVHDYVKRNDKH
jgi:hypothetical protein